MCSEPPSTPPPDQPGPSSEFPIPDSALTLTTSGSDSQLGAVVPPAPPGEPPSPPPPPPPPRVWGSAGGEGPGDSIGPYRLLERIGEGGFGVVWLAERREPMVQRVALKVIKPGMDSRAVIARFEQERQALAVMDHPNVARVVDGGVTASGRPYFVMEHVKGEPINTFADRQRLTIKQRLELFIPVCEAVQHAHMKGIIHRDLKPSNILVAPGGEGHTPIVKVIDFGVAKAISQTLTDKTIFTERGQIIGTPEYMSPEQAEMGATDIDTRSDVYSLGVVLYELLSGTLPFESKTLRAAGYAEIQRIIREVDPPKPSTKLSTADDQTGASIAKARQAERERLTSELRRELEWIPMKALRKDRTRRYASAESLRADVHRYLEGRPLEAGPESAGYRFSKYMRRNKGPVAAAVAVGTALGLGLVGTLWNAEEARRQAERANDLAAAASMAEFEARSAAAEQRRLAEAEAAARHAADVERAKVIAASQEIEYNAYIANIELAAAALESRQFGRVREKLNACSERLRGWEWRWLNASIDNSLLQLREPGHSVTSASFSHDGRRVATGFADGYARVWTAAKGDALVQLARHSDWVIGVTFSPDDSRILTTSNDKTVRLWDTSTGTALAEMSVPDDLCSFSSFSPDGNRIVTACRGGTAQLWDARSGCLLTEFIRRDKQINGLAFSPDSTRVVIGYADNTAWVWDLATGTPILDLDGHTAAITSVAFSPDGKRIVTASGDRTARVWNAVTGKSIHVLKGHRGIVNRAEFSPDGTQIVTCSRDETARIWAADTGVDLWELKGHSSNVYTAVFSPDGTQIVTASADCSSRVWNADSGKFVIELRGHDSPITDAGFSPDSARILTVGRWESAAYVWDAFQGPDPLALGESRGTQGATAVFSPDGHRLATSWEYRGVRVWDVDTGEPLISCRDSTAWVSLQSFNAEATRLVTSYSDGSVRVWDANSGENTKFLGSSFGLLTVVAISPDGTRAVTIGNENVARVWDIARGTQVAELRGHSDRVLTAAYSSDGLNIVTGSHDRTVRVWDALTGVEVRRPLGEHEGSVTHIALSQEGSRVVAVLSNGSARVWDLKSGTNMSTLRPTGSQGEIVSAALSPDGSRIIATTSSGRALLWDAVTGRALIDVSGHQTKTESAVFSPDGTHIATTSTDGLTKIHHSVPYRDRVPEIERTWDAVDRMDFVVQAGLEVGSDPEHLLKVLVSESRLKSVERRAVQYLLFLPIDSVNQNANAYAYYAEQLNLAVWKRVRFAPVTQRLADQAVVDARTAVYYAPTSAAMVNTLGVALFRAERFDEAITELERSEALYEKANQGPEPVNWAFIAMARWKLGHQEEARTALAKFRELVAFKESDEEISAWTKELTDLIPAQP